MKMLADYDKHDDKLQTGPPARLSDGLPLGSADEDHANIFEHQENETLLHVEKSATGVDTPSDSDARAATGPLLSFNEDVAPRLSGKEQLDDVTYDEFSPAVQDAWETIGNFDVCWFRGRCRAGVSCPYSHLVVDKAHGFVVSAKQVVDEADRLLRQWEKDMVKYGYAHLLSGGAGAAVVRDTAGSTSEGSVGSRVARLCGQ